MHLPLGVHTQTQTQKYIAREEHGGVVGRGNGRRGGKRVQVDERGTTYYLLPTPTTYCLLPTTRGPAPAAQPLHQHAGVGGQREHARRSRFCRRPRPARDRRGRAALRWRSGASLRSRRAWLRSRRTWCVRDGRVFVQEGLICVSRRACLRREALVRCPHLEGDTVGRASETFFLVFFYGIFLTRYTLLGVNTNGQM